MNPTDRSEVDGGKSTFASWVELLRDRSRILDLGTGEQGGLLLETRGRVIRVDVQSRLHPNVVADAMALPFNQASFDAILAMSILEHVPRPWVVVREIRRVLQPGGLVIGYVPFMYPYHADPSFHDYYRFSDEAIIELFRDFRSVELMNNGGYTNAMFRFLAGFTASQRHLLRVERFASAFLAGLAKSTGIWESTRVRGLRRTTTGYNFLVRK